MPADSRRVKELFVAALDLPNDASRRAWLDQECGDDHDLRRRVDVLLAAHDEPISALERPLAADLATRSFASGDAAATRPPSREKAGSVVGGRYKLLERIGEGGMGEVWLADQLEPIRRRVALKLIKPGMDSRAVLARFEAERQALALMDHPNIARVLDAGAAEDGWPYFVMELVKGAPITEFCDVHRLSPRERLELFVPVCRAIQHAHQKGVIHRDIKPSNVLVAPRDERPIPKVIDFGVAKAIGGQLTDMTLHTGFGSLIGTPAYMAPEQAAFNQNDVDTRTDVYALGVLLYELLAGSPPFEPERLKRAAIDEVLRVVRDEEPPRPSARLSTSSARASLAAVRRSDPKNLPKLLRGDLDWIVMKALEKERNRRYDAATGLAADVQRYLDGEPVQAHPPGAMYLLRKFVRKHRVALGIAGAFVGLLIVSAVVNGWLAIMAGRSAALAARQRALAEVNAHRADATAERLAVALAASERAAASLQIDMDLNKQGGDARLGLLHLARDYRAIPAEARDLREFVAAAVLAGGQEFTPLLPPISLNGRKIVDFALAPDRRTAVTLDPDGAARLWAILPTPRPVALLHQGDERVVACGYSPDGRTVVTDDRTGVARFWNVADGAFRAATAPRPNRYAARKSGEPSHVQPGMGDRRLLTFGAKDIPAGPDNSPPARAETIGPVELWDTATGRLAGRLDAPDRPAHDYAYRLDRGGRWVLADSGARPVLADPGGWVVLVFSAEDGRLVARLEHPEGRLQRAFADSNGRRVGVVVEVADQEVLRVWDPDRGWTEPTVTLPPKKYFRETRIAWWIGDAFGGESEWSGFGAVLRLGPPPEILSVESVVSGDTTTPDAELVRLDGGGVFDTRTWRRLIPPAGRKFHPDLARFAPDGRFVMGLSTTHQEVVIDIRTEKQFLTGCDFYGNTDFFSSPYRRQLAPYAHVPGFGLVAVDAHLPGAGPATATSLHFHTIDGISKYDQCSYAVDARVIPIDLLREIPADLLEDWLHVALRGELAPDGAFAPWDEPTWDRKRRELAARSAPPLPGFVAHDPLHWLKQEFAAPLADADRLGLAAELLRRAETIGDRAEAAHWRDEKAALEAGLAPKPAEGP